MLNRVPSAEVVPNSPKTKKETRGLTNKPRQKLVTAHCKYGQKQ